MSEPAATQVAVLSAGAVRGLFEALRLRDFPAAGLRYTGSFGAVGAMQEKLLAGEPCDLLVLTLPMLRALAERQRIEADGIRVIGSVATGIAVRSATPRPDVHSVQALRGNLLAARGIHFPDPARATAGVHFANVLTRLGIAARVADKCRHYPNGATAMAALAQEGGPLQIGCTQASEILYTPGVDLVGYLPEPYALSTVYAAALTRDCRRPEAAAAMLDLLAGPASATLRSAGGFMAASR